MQLSIKSIKIKTSRVGVLHKFLISNDRLYFATIRRENRVKSFVFYSFLPSLPDMMLRLFSKRFFPRCQDPREFPPDVDLPSPAWLGREDSFVLENRFVRAFRVSHRSTLFPLIANQFDWIILTKRIACKKDPAAARAWMK